MAAAVTAEAWQQGRGDGHRGSRAAAIARRLLEFMSQDIKGFVDGPMEGHRTQKGHLTFELLENNPTEDRPSESVVETSPRPPLIMVMGRSWSPSIYGLLGNTVDVAWRMAFTILSLLFNNLRLQC